MQNSNKQIAFGTIMSYLSIVISCVGAIVVTPFIVKCLGDSSYGVYRIIVSLIAYMSILNFGFGSSAVRYISEFREQECGLVFSREREERAAIFARQVPMPAFIAPNNTAETGRGRLPAGSGRWP